MEEIKMNSTVLITGAGGFLGGELIEQLCQKSGCNTIALTSNQEKLSLKYPHFKNLQIVDNEDFFSGSLPLHKVDTLIHTAFARGHKSKKEIAKSLDFTNNLFLKSVGNIKNIINISSQGVYGQENKPLWTEDMLVAPESPYAIAKYSSELLLKNIKELSKGEINISNIRLPGLTGGRSGMYSSAIVKFVKSTLEGNEINIVGGEQQISLMDVRDAATGILALLNAPKWEEVYNLGNNNMYKIIDIAKTVNLIAEKRQIPPVSINVQKSDISTASGMDSSLFFKDIKWEPKYNLEDTIQSIYDYLR